MKNKYIWLSALTAILIIGIVSCNSSVNKQAKTEPVETVEEFDEDSTLYSDDTTAIDDESVMEEVAEEEEE